MKANRMITFAAVAALGLASALPAQERERRSSDRERRDRSGRSDEAQQSPESTTRPSAAGYSERYAILEKNNIFVRDRSRPTTRSSSGSSTTQPARRTPEESLVVRGIAMEELGYRAYLEDLNNGTTVRVSPGDPLARGRVAAVALDAIQFEYDGNQTWIEIGSDLTGKPSAASSAPYASATTAPTTLPANIDLNDPSLSVEQRMRLRVQLQNQQSGR